KFSVGLLAQAGDWDPRRSVPADLLVSRLAPPGGRDAPLAIWRGSAEPRLALFNLQLDRPLAGLPDVSTPDVLLLARRLRSLDLVVTPDTMLAHLAGALGVPTWTLLPADADWRWLQPDRTDSPWYPTMHLIRQSRPGDWQPVVDEVFSRLESLV